MSLNLVVAVAFLFLKTGEKFATQEAAGPTVAGLTAYIGEKLGGVALEPLVQNDPKKASEVADSKKPALGIVTPGFYLAYSKALGMEPLLEVHCQNVAAERYVVVAPSDFKRGPAEAGFEAWRGAIVATTLASEERYVVAVILQNKLGDEVRLKTVTDVEGAIFDLAEEGKNAANLVLVENVAWKLFEKDEELGPKLKVVFTSDELPRDLVVLFRPSAGDLDADKLKATLKEMGSNEAGRRVLNSIRVEAFEDVNSNRLARVQELFRGK